MADTLMAQDPTTLMPQPILGTRLTQAEQAAQARRTAQTDRLCALARSRFALAAEAEAPWRQKAVEALRFRAGEQWHPDQVKARQDPRNPRPCLTINQVPRFIRQITNAEQQNRPTIKVRPVDSLADPQTAKVYDGLIRAIEAASDGDIATDTAFDSAVTHGRGYWRVLIDYETPWSFQKVLKIDRILNPFAVYLDPQGRQHPDYHTANWGFVVERLNREVACEKYEVPHTTYAMWSSYGDTWVGKDECLLADYYYRDEFPVQLVQLRDGDVRYVPLLRPDAEATDEEREADATLLQHVAWKMTRRGIYPMTEDAMGRVQQERRSSLPVLYQCKLLGYTPVEGPTVWPGQYIPIVPVLGDEIDIEGQTEWRGLVWDMMDAARAYNYWTALAVDTPLPTPTGWTTMADVQPGDAVLDEQGYPCTVEGISPVHTQNTCYCLTFDDGSTLVADKGHWWTVEERINHSYAARSWRRKTLRTEELQAGKHFIDVTKPLDLPKQSLPVHPYVLGVWLGDGSSLEPTITAGAQDLEALREALEQCGCTLGVSRRQKTAWNFTLHGIRKQLHALGLYEAGKKHIPSAYLRASIEQRLALLQGLMDTDGSIDAKHQCSFTTTLPALRDGVAELLRSLGIKCLCLERERKEWLFPNGKWYKPSRFWQFSFSTQEGLPLFRLPRKLARQLKKTSYHPRRTHRHAIVSIEPVPAVPVKCISVDSPSHLYLAGVSMIPTHNTLGAETVALAPKAPWIGTVQQFRGREQEWAGANQVPYAYLAYNMHSEGGLAAPPPQRNVQEPAIMAIANARQQAAQDLYNTSGIQPADLGEASSTESSGKHAQIRKTESELGTSHYRLSLVRALRHRGRILIDLIPAVYHEPGRILRILGVDQQASQVQVDPLREQPVAGPDAPDGLDGIVNLNVGTYDVAVDVGPGYLTQRQEAAANLIELASALPKAAEVIPDLIIGMQEWDGAEEAARRLKKTLPPQLLDEQSRTPEDQVAQLTAQLQQTKQEAQALNAHAQQVEQTAQQMAQENQQLKGDQSVQHAEVQLKHAEMGLKQMEMQLKQRELALKELELQVKREEVQLRAQVDMVQANAEIEKARLSVQAERADAQEDAG